MSIEQRVCKLFAKADGCWEWLGFRRAGYGRFWISNEKVAQAHHVPFFLKTGRWPEYVMHSCDNPGCVNPDHLVETSHKVNMMDRNKKMRLANVHGNKVPAVRRMLAEGIKQKDIAVSLSMSQATVSEIKSGRKWGHVA